VFETDNNSNDQKSEEKKDEPGPIEGEVVDDKK
jgi:hypothetical protein